MSTSRGPFPTDADVAADADTDPMPSSLPVVGTDGARWLGVGAADPFPKAESHRVGISVVVMCGEVN